MRARFLRGLILALSSLSLVAAFSLTNVPDAQATACYPVHAYNDSSRSVRVALGATSGGHTIYPLTEAVGHWRYVVVPSGDQVYVTSGSGATSTYGPGTHRVTKWTCAGNHYDVGRIN